jgi:hypothetical protein
LSKIRIYEQGRERRRVIVIDDFPPDRRSEARAYLGLSISPLSQRRPWA